MTTVNGQNVTPRLATQEEAALIQEIYDLKAQAKAIYEKIDTLYAKLEVGIPLVATLTQMNEDNVAESALRTVVLGKPQGHYVYYKELGFVLDQKTTKADQTTLNEGKK